MVLVTSVGASLYVTREVNDRDYRILVENWDTLNQASKYAIIVAMVDGKITHWESQGFRRLLLEQNGGLVLPREHDGDGTSKQRVVNLL